MISLADALAWLRTRAEPLPAELVPAGGAAGRVLAEAVRGPLRTGAVAAIDGHAVRAAETEGASEYAPLPVGGTAVVAGAGLPAGTDAVLPLTLLEAGPAALGAVAPGHGVAQGGTVRLPVLTTLRPAHLALLTLLGCERVAVVRRPVVAVRVAGAKSGADALTPMLSALIGALGGELAAARPDLHLHAGRSGPGPDDDGIHRFETVFAHGILIRPGETAGLGTIGGRPAILLPGEPIACAVSFALLAAPFLRRLAGVPDPAPVMATLAGKIVSGIGQIDAVLVRVDGGRATPLGAAGETPLAAMAEADGIVLVPEGSEGYPEGAMIAVHPFP